MFRKFYQSAEESGTQRQSKKMKRYRSAFTTGQINFLEKQFKKCPYIGSATRKEVGNVLNIPERAIKIWFQNRRMKEKKEAINKEQVMDRQNHLINDTEFPKYSLNNVHSSQSANDRQCSLQSKSNQADHVNSVTYNDVRDSKFSNQIKIETFTKEMINFDRSPIDKSDNAGKNPFLIQPIGKPNLIRHNLNNDCNHGKFIKCFEKNKQVESKRKAIPKQLAKSGPPSRMQKISSTVTECQDLPEDLSASKLVPNVMIPQNPYGNVNSKSAYVQYCNTGNFCFSPGNFVWNPLNVMSVPPNGLPVPGQPHEANQNKSKLCNCNCNCTVRNRFNYNQGLVAPPPQYVIAIPFTNNPNIL